MQGPYAQYILDATDVCSNCHRQNRVERIDPTRNGFNDDTVSHYERKRRETSVEYPGVGTNPTDCKGVFCGCGVEGAFERLWSPTAVDRGRFKQLLKATLGTVDAKGVTLRKQETAVYALSHFDDHGDVDRALANALDAGIVAAAASDGQGSSDQLRADGGPSCDNS